MRILAIDSATHLGYAISTPEIPLQSGTIDASPRGAARSPTGFNEPLFMRYVRIEEGVTNLVKRACPDLDDLGSLFVVCEGSSGFTRGHASVAVANEIRGVIKMVLGKLGPPWPRYLAIAPNKIKHWATGSHFADKGEMVAAAQRLGYKGRNDDEADAFILLHLAQATGENGLLQLMVAKKRKMKRKMK